MRPQGREVRLGFIGLGSWGMRLAASAREVDGVIVEVGCSRDRSRRDAFAGTFGCRVTADVDELLALDVDAVVIATPHSTHRRLVERALAAGRHVLVEKPLTLTVEDGRAVVDAARAAGLVLQVGHQRRLLPANAAIRRWVRDGELGELALIQATIASPSGLMPRPGWQSDPAERPLGGMTGLGVHMVDTLLSIAGPAATVSARSHTVGVQGPIDTVTTLEIGLSSGAIGQIAVSTVVARAATVTAHGTFATAWSEHDGTRLFHQACDAASRSPVDVPSVDALKEQMGCFARSVRDGDQPDADGEAGLAVVRVMAAARLSVSRGGAVIPIHEVG